MPNNLRNEDLKNKLKVIVTCIIVYIIITIPFKYFFSIVATSELRPSAALTPAFGLLFGPLGAIGAATGNLIGDIFAGYSIEVCIIGFLCQFLYAYIPYKLWYSFKFRSKIIPPRVNTVNNLIKYVIIVFISSTIMTWLLAFLMELLNISSFISFTTLIFEFNNFDFTLTLGVLIIVLANFYNLKFYIPKKKENFKIPTKVYDISLYLGLLVGTLFTIYSLIYNSEQYAIIIGLIYYILIIIFTFRPMTNNIKIKSKVLKMSLSEKLIVMFVFIGVIIAFFTGLFLFFENSSSYGSSFFWEIIYLNIALIITIFYFIAILFLWKIEKDITIPIESITDATTKYVNNSNENTDSTQTISQINKFKDYDGEIGVLSHSFKYLITELESYSENIKKETKEKERLNTEVNIGKKIQKSMIPEKFPNNEKFEVYGKNSTSEEFRGDFYDYVLIDEDKILITISNISEKGIPAALIMMQVKTLIKNYAELGYDVSEIFYNVNNELLLKNNENTLVSAFIGIFDTKSAKFSYINTMDKPPIIKHENEYQVLNTKKQWDLGFKINTTYEIEDITLHPQDIICLYDDIYSKEDISSELIEIMKNETNSLESIVNNIKNKNLKVLLLKYK
ncbi:SpoIIE family protein phosphatase [Methanobrevibacter sp. OttesenSCG-928-K11]|nr:SpoIIE family protein phosphatase [Methanobrevibacter sp. OttesenSCG-928-K11]